MKKLFTLLISLTFVALSGINVSYAGQTLLAPAGGPAPTQTMSPNKTGVPDDSVLTTGKTSVGRKGVADDSVHKYPPGQGPGYGPAPGSGSGDNTYPSANRPY